MSVKLYLLLCQNCGYKRFTDGSDVGGLVEVKTSKLMTSIPTLDPSTQKTVPAKFKNQKKRFKCPRCGKVIFPKKLKDEQPNNDIRHKTGDEGFSVPQ